MSGNSPLDQDGGVDAGACLTATGSREPDPQAVPALTGFDPSRGADDELIYQALRFYFWAAGEGISPINVENALEPEEGFWQYSLRSGDEEWETVAERFLTRSNNRVLITGAAVKTAREWYGYHERFGRLSEVQKGEVHKLALLLIRFRDSDGSGAAVETAGLDPQGDSAGRVAASPDQSGAA